MKGLVVLIVISLASNSAAQINYAHNDIHTVSTYFTITIDDDIELGITTAYNISTFNAGSLHLVGGLQIPPLSALREWAVFLGSGFVPATTGRASVGAGLQAEVSRHYNINPITSLGFRPRISPGYYSNSSFSVDVSYLFVPISSATDDLRDDKPSGIKASELTIGGSASISPGMNFALGNHSNINFGAHYPVIRNKVPEVIESPMAPVRLNVGMHFYNRD